MELTGRTAGIIIAVVALIAALGVYVAVSTADLSGPAPLTCAERGGTSETGFSHFMYTGDGGIIPQLATTCVMPGE